MRRFSIIAIITIPALLFSLALNGEDTSVPNGGCVVLKKSDSMRELLPPCWFQKAAALKITTLKRNLRYGHELSVNPEEFAKQIDEIKAQGFQAIEIFAPAEGLQAYNGLDTKNFYQIDPELGTMDDFRRLVRIAHSKGIAVVAFINLGYFSVEAPDWIEAGRDKKAGKVTEKVKWFLWSDKPDSPRPPTQEDVYVSKADMDKQKDYWGWHYSDLAGAYYWARWKATAKDGSAIPLPQVNWGAAEWKNEAERIVRFWMNTGLDGMLIDAPLCYPNQTWTDNRQYITSVIASYGNVLMDPEGGRDPAWITEAGYNTIHDYQVTGGGGEPIVEAMKSGDPREIERRLRDYHDLMFHVGAVLYGRGPSSRVLVDPVQAHLDYAVLAGVGDLVVMGKAQGNPDAEETWLLKTKAEHPALHAMAARRKISTDADDKYYAILKTARDRSERILAVYNFQSTPQTVKVDLGVVDMSGLIDLKTSAKATRPNVFTPVPVDLPAFGYRFFRVLAPDAEKTE